MKEGISTMYKNQDRPMQEYEFITLTERAEKHSSRHPSDSNVPKTERGVTWGKAGKRTAELKKFYKDLNNNVLKIFNVKNSVNSKNSFGGTSEKNIKKMIKKYKKELK